MLVQTARSIEVVLTKSINSADLLKAFVHAAVLSQMQATAGSQVQQVAVMAGSPFGVCLHLS